MKRLAVIIFTLAMPVFAQQPPATPQLTEVQKLKLENIQLKYTQLTMTIQEAQKQQEGLSKDYQAIALEVSKEHPGYMLSQGGNLVPAPKAPERPKEVKPVDKLKEEPKK
jgi:hypothetical protein